MEATLMTWVQALLAWFSLPEVGLGAVFLVSLVSATLLPLGSEPAVYALVSLKPDLFWPTVAVATAGNTLGGAISWWMGRAAHRASDHLRHRAPDSDLPPGAGQAEGRAARWLGRFGPVACLLSWLPVVGDPLCAVAGWLRMPFWPCLGYMAVGKALRYVTMTAALLWMI
jgi:membrane protein YqaA with SNARE-associated domain